MAEKIKLLELDIDLEKMLKKGAEAKKSIEFLQKEVKFFQGSIKEGNQLIPDYRDSLAKMESQGKKNTKEYKIQENNLKSLVNSQEENRKKLELVQSNLRKQQKQYRLNKKGVDSYNKSVINEIQIIEKTDGSIEQLDNALANNRKQYRKLTKSQRENTEAGKLLLEVINKQDKEYKDLQKSIGTTQVDVGNYKGQIKELLDENLDLSKSFQSQVQQIPVVGGVLGNLYGTTIKYIGAQKASIAATNGKTKVLKRFKLALLGTGIGAIVVLIGLLVAGFNKSQKAVDFFNQKLAGIKAVIGVITDGFAAFADFVILAIEEPGKAWSVFTSKLKTGWKFIKGQVIDRFLASWTILKNSFIAAILKMRIAWNDFTGDSKEAEQLRGELKKINEETNKSRKRLKELNTEAISTFKNAAKGAINYAKQLEAARKKGELLKKQLQQINKEEILLDIQRSASKKKLKELNKAVEDVTKSDQDRIQAAKESQKIQEQILNKSVELGKRRLANLVGEAKGYTNRVDGVVKSFEQGTISVQDALNSLGIDRSKVQDLEQFRDVFTQIQDKQSEFVEFQTTTQNKVNTIIQQGTQKAIAAAKERAYAEIKSSQIALSRYIIENDKINSTLDQRVDAYKSALHREENILKQQLETNKITQEEYDLAVLEKKQEYADKIAQATVENLNKELELYIAQNKTKLDEETALTDELVLVEQNRLQGIYEKRLEILEKQKEEELLSEQDFQLQKLQLHTEFLEKKEEVENQLKEFKKEAEQLDYENELETRRLRGENEYQLRLEELE
jgi:hypothetical protein